jgi:hypothetical protein
MRIASVFRGLLLPNPLRVPAPDWPGGFLPALQDLADALAAAESQREEPETWPSLDDLIEVAISLWRLQKRLSGPGGGTEPLEGRERDHYHLMAAIDSLQRAGVKVRDHDGMPFSGIGSEAIDALAFQPTPGLDRQRVIRTVLPTVFLRGEWARMGKVIIGVPEPAEQNDRTDDHQARS